MFQQLATKFCRSLMTGPQLLMKFRIIASGIQDWGMSSVEPGARDHQLLKMVYGFRNLWTSPKISQIFHKILLAKIVYVLFIDSMH